jgi:hypothetical protein
MKPSRYTFVVIPDNDGRKKQFNLSTKFTFFILFTLITMITTFVLSLFYFIPKVLEFNKMEKEYNSLVSERMKVLTLYNELERLKEVDRMVQKALGMDMVESKDGDKGLVKPKGNKPINLDLIYNIPSILPVDGILTQEMIEKFDDFSKQHLGVDIAVPEQTPILASASGQVIFSGMTENLGNLVVLFHGNEYFTYYGHNASIDAKLHQFISIGDTIARSGNTGESSGPHLHFEIWKDGEAVNPLSYFPNYNKLNMSVE